MGRGDALKGARAVAEDFRPRGFAYDNVASFVAVEPERQGLLEAQAAGLLAVFPDGDDDGLLRLAVGRLGASPVAS
jgi:hypothetical protein